MRVILWWLLALVFSSSTLIFLFTGTPSHCSGSRRSSAPTSIKPKQVKNSRIIQNAGNTGQGIPNRIQCSDLNSTWIPPKCPNSHLHRLALVSLFIPPPPDECHQNSQRPSAILQTFSQSIRLSMPGSHQILLTDGAPLTGINLPSGIQVESIPGNYSRSNLMLQRLDSYISFLERSSDRRQHLIFSDSDMIIVGDLGCVFLDHTDFDVALTYRNNKEQPINSGLIFVRGEPESLVRAREFLKEVVRVFRRDFSSASKMMGDQLAFARVVNRLGEFSHRFRGREEFLEKVGGVRVLFLPCSSYNWTPAEGAGQFHGMPLDTRVIHFKGSRKRLMLESWEAHKGKFVSGNSLLPLACFVLQSGRAKYDF